MVKVKKRLSAEERKKQIIKSAIKVFAKSSYHAVRVADIAKEAGISEAMLYKHFSSKKDIFIEILKDMSKRLNLFWQREKNTEENPLVVLKKLVIGYHRRVMKHPDQLKLQFLALSEVGDKDILKQLQNDNNKNIQFIKELIVKGIKQGLIRKDIDVDALVYINIGGGVLTHMMKLLSFEKKYTEKIVEAAIDHIINSIRIKSASKNIF